MKFVSTSIGALLLSLVMLSPRTGAQEPPKSHLDLDWQAPRRWVHVDNLDSEKAALFVNARIGWLEKLRRDDGLLGDGRPLFWHARSSKAGETFFSFYPFRTWTDLDTRGQMATETVKAVGEDALKAYDSGDEALVFPHYSQIWSRVAEYDIAVPATASMSAPSIRDVLDTQLGLQKSAELRRALDGVFPVEEFYAVERRADLSNLGR